jgi:L-seryl-tRNA(Ser) seleniumtransferase
VRPLARKGSGVETVAAAFRALPVPVIGRIRDGALWLDLRCLDGAQEPEFVAQLDQLEPAGSAP